MSELMKTTARHTDFRWRLLTTVSALALIAVASTRGKADASDDADRPTVWIELSGQLEAMGKTQDEFTAPFLSGPQTLEPFSFHHDASGVRTLVPEPAAPFYRSQPLQAQKPPKQSFGGEAKLSFQPDGSDWVLSASVRYGRSNGKRNTSQQTASRMPYIGNTSLPSYIRTPDIVRFSDAAASYKESHAVLDFQVGKDVGLGIFGRHASSILNLGVRFAQFTSSSAVTVKADPYLQIYSHAVIRRPTNPTKYNKYHFDTRFHTYALAAHSARSFHGIGPSLSWSGSAPFVGNSDTAEFTFDWGVNGAVLFGRQKSSVEHKTGAYDRYHTQNFIYDARHTQYKNHRTLTRSKSVIVPNLGGFAGVSLKFPNAKVSLGYRADFFFGAIDAGIDTSHMADVSFHGPFASISIGLGG